MKKVTSILLSAVIMLTAVLGFNCTALAAGTIATATDYSLGTSVSGVLNGDSSLMSEDKQYLKLTLTESGKVTFTVTSSDSTHVSVYADNDIEDDIVDFFVEHNYNLGYNYEKGDVYLNSGTYYVEISSYEDCSYTVSSEFASANESFAESTTVNNDVIGRANQINLATTYNGMIGNNDETDFYCFTAPVSGEYVINVNGTGKIYADICASDGDSLKDFIYYVNSNTGLVQDSDTFTLNAGTYYLKLSGSNPSFYSFSVSQSHTHVYNFAYTVAPTTTSQGYDVYTCSCGDSYQTNYTQKLPVHTHSYSYSYTVSPSLNEEGYDVYACSCGDFYETNFTAAILPPSKVTLNKLTTSKNHSIKATWKKTKADGYQIQFSTNKKFKKATNKYVGSSKTSVTAKKLKKGKKYYVRVRAYKYVDDSAVYGKWSSVKTIKCK